MARIQSKTCGRKPPKISILPRDMKAKAEEALIELGQPSLKWGDFKGKPSRSKRAPLP